MKQVLGGIVAVLLLTASLSAAEHYNISWFRDCKQCITTIQRVVEPPALVLEKEKPIPGVVLDAKDWVCGRCFTDGDGRRWCLIGGPPLSEKPAKVPGWIPKPKEGILYFLTPGGSMFTLCPPRGVGPLVPLGPPIFGDHIVDALRQLNKEVGDTIREM